MGGPPEKFLGKNTLGTLRGGASSTPAPARAPPRPAPRPAPPRPSPRPPRALSVVLIPALGSAAWGEGIGVGGEEVGALPSGAGEEEGE